MAKIDEIKYVENLSALLEMPQEALSKYLLEKPFNDPLRHRYFTDMGQLMALLPPSPARILDLGVGAGWTSRFLYRCGYSVVGLDIAPTMIGYAKQGRLPPKIVDFRSMSATTKVRSILVCLMLQ